MQERGKQELALLRSYFPGTEYVEGGQWVRVPDYPLPVDPPWNKQRMDVCFQIPPAYPGAPPYGFYVPADLRCGDSPPHNGYKTNLPAKPPFDGDWGFFSWSTDGPWRATADLRTGSNLTNFVQTFADRLRQGV